jgi:DNA-binding response OmpR family regulator
VFSPPSGRTGDNDKVMRVLVIEDEPRLAEGLRLGLVADGFAVDVAQTGTDGLWLAREAPFDAIVLDLMLPGIDGAEICQTLRAEDNWTPILILTARSRETDEVEGLDIGADDYLTKPFSHAVLVARLRALIRRGAPPRPAGLGVRDIRLDPASRRVWRGDEEITLTAREVSVLEYLLRRPGEVVSKREILDHVWDFGFEGDPNVVEVYVGRLRDKVGRDAIETVRGSGYRVVGNG